MNRKEYLESPLNNHRAYYKQYISLKLKNLVNNYLSQQIIESSNINDIPIQAWQRLTKFIPNNIIDKVKSNGDTFSIHTGVCILKEAAKQIKNNENR